MDKNQEKSLKKIEYNRIVDMLVSRCGFEPGRELARALLPLATRLEAEQGLAETSEGCELLRLYPTFSLGPIRDLRQCLQHVSIGGILTVEELLNVADCSRAARLTRSFFMTVKGNMPILIGLARGLAILKTIETAVEKAIDNEGKIADEASERLYSIRKKIKVSSERVRDRLENIIKNPDTAKYLQEPIVTMRDGRFVVPVRQECRSQIPGVAHDVSASGASVFIEPLAVVELNNDIQRLYRDEEEEVAAILRALTNVVAGFLDELQSNMLILAKLDFILAKAKLAASMNAVAPKINEKDFIHLKKARHPLISAERVVPTDIKLEKSQAAMIITGPNTGGKTVTLKTVGLLTQMALAGLHIPAEYGSELPFYHQVFADIGDEQSIEQSLSTFSAHMVNIINILQAADDNTLVLLDELGAGTDPTEGAALAMAILDTLKKGGSKILATTHYSELKAFAFNNPGYLNASVEFDVATLSPTYRLMAGVPGKSNAFEIATRLGLSKRVIDEAATFLTDRDAQIADLLAGLEEARQEAAAEREQAEALRLSLQAKERLLEEEKQLAQVEASKIIAQATAKSKKIVEDTIEKSKKDYEEMRARFTDEKEAARAYETSRRKLKDWQKELEEVQPKRVYLGSAPKQVEVGERVFVPSLNNHGTVLEVVEGGASVQLGILKVMVKLEDMRLADPQQDEKNIAERKFDRGMRMEKAKAMKSEISIRHLEVTEALDVLDKYLDDAFVAGLQEVRVVHGKGQGIMRAAVTDYLKGHRLVSSFRLGEYQEGGNGVTIVTLDR